jgi:hypothetical protein
MTSASNAAWAARYQEYADRYGNNDPVAAARARARAQAAANAAWAARYGNTENQGYDWRQNYQYRPPTPTYSPYQPSTARAEAEAIAATPPADRLANPATDAMQVVTNPFAGQQIVSIPVTTDGDSLANPNSIRYSDDFRTDNPEFAQKIADETGKPVTVTNPGGGTATIYPGGWRPGDPGTYEDAVARQRGPEQVATPSMRGEDAVSTGTPIIRTATPARSRLSDEQREVLGLGPGPGFDGGYQIYAPAKVTHDAEGNLIEQPVFLGEKWEHRGGGAVVGSDVAKSMEEILYLGPDGTTPVNMPLEMQQDFWELVDRWYEGQRDVVPQSWLPGVWHRAVTRSAMEYERGVKMTPIDALEMEINEYQAWQETNGRSSGGGGSYGYGYGGGGGYGGGSVSTVQLTNPTDARIILNQAMSQYMGRQATSKEIEQFVRALNAQEMANPITQAFEGDTTVQSGGFNPATFAEDYARAQEGSSEFQAANLLGSFMGMLSGNRVI